MTTSLRIRLLAASCLLVGVAFVQEPGLLVPDTKYDLAASPLEFLGRASRLWDGDGAFGQLQNQAYGYLWPMGPFFAAGWLLDLPGWVVQRLWLALVMVVALVGTTRLARALGVRSDLACLAAGLAFALSPRMLTTLGPISIEAWPSAVAPWVLLALVRGTQSGSPRRWAALAGLGVAVVGGVNAAATFAVLPLGAVWLLTREPGPRRRSLLLWWPVFTLLGTLWWLVPLFVMGAYSPPFLDYIETTAVTTFPSTLFDALRGTANWVPYVDPGSRAGHDLISSGYLVLDGSVLLLLGVAGLVTAPVRHRAFLALALLAGVLMVTAGHHGAVAGWFAGDVRAALDGPLAPLRNVHKFDPVVRLPLVLGLAFLLDRVLAQRPRALAGRVNRTALVGLAVVAIAGAATPAVVGRVAPAGATIAVPGYWHQAADWLAEHDDGRVALLVPGSRFADYQWGSPRDEPLQHLARSRWAVRNVIPLVPEGNIRMLDEVESRIAQGWGSAGLTAQLRRSGVGHLVVRNDLRPGEGVPDPVVVHRALADSPGLRRVAAFGPNVGGEAHLPRGDDGRVVVNGGWQTAYPAVEVYEVPAGRPHATTSSPSLVVGGPEDLAGLADLGVLVDTPTVLAADLPEELPGSMAALPGRDRVPLVLTDGLRARERAFARIHDGESATRGAGDPRRTASPAPHYLPSGWAPWQTVARVDGVDDVRASSSASDAGVTGGTRRGEHPLAALDGDPGSAWVSGEQSGRPWWEVQTPVEAPELRLTGGPAASDRQLLRVRTDQGVTEPLRVGPGETRRFRLPAGRTVRVRVEDASGVPGTSITIAEVELPGVTAQRRLLLPPVPEAWGDPDVVVLRRDADARQGCLEVDGAVRCVPGRAVPSEEPGAVRRTFELRERADWDSRLRVRPRAGPALDALVQQGQLVAAEASSTAVADPRGGAVAAVDGDPGTAWFADPNEPRPTLDLRWVGQRAVRGLTLRLPREAAARLPTRVRLVWDGGSREVRLRDGRARFPAIRTDALQLQVLASEDAASLGFDALPTELGVGIGEVSLDGVPALPLALSDEPVRLGCDSGPRIIVSGRSYRTSVTASPASLLAGAEATATVCRRNPGEPIRITPGTIDVDLEPSAAFLADSLVLRRGDAALPSPTRSVTGEWPDPVTRVVRVDDEAGLLAVRENHNPGWTATRGGAPLEPVIVDGWQQGWWLTGAAQDEADDVVARFGPDRPYRAGLLGGLLAGLLLLGLIVWGRRWRDDPAPVAGREPPAALTAAAGVLTAGLVAGWVGAVLGTVIAVAVVAWLRWLPQRRELLGWLLAAPCLVAGLGYAVRPWGSDAGWAGEWAWPGYLLLVSVVGVVTLAGRSRTTRFNRSAGRSTSR